jgi:ribose transport system permease protein
VAASTGAMLGASLAAIAACGLIGVFSGVTITFFRIPPFIATLAMMQVASGLAFIVARGESIYDIPASYTWLGRGESLGIPNSVILMLVAYVAAHLLMTRTVIGRRIYAVGGNEEASRLSGVSNRRVLLFVYLVSGLAAGVGGVITASQLKAGAPTYGLMYELNVIAAVVVGGTSLTGGEGRIFGTLVGAFIIAVIRNGMNLMNVEPYTQKIVLGLVILAAVLLDMLRRRRVR